jgi:hypothetical protein
MNDYPPIRRDRTHVNSVGMRLYPREALLLGNGFTERKYKEFLPDLYKVATLLEILSSNATRVQLRSADAKPTELLGLRINEARRRRKRDNREYMPAVVSPQRAMSVLLGRKRMLLLHSRATIDNKGPKVIVVPDGQSQKEYLRSSSVPINFFIQPVPFHIDYVTGEIHDDIALKYIQECDNRGFLAQLYRLSERELGAIVMLGNDYDHGTALEIAKNLASVSPFVRAKWCSLLDRVHSPLSLNDSCEPCAWYGHRLEDSAKILQSLIDFAAPHLPSDDSLTSSSSHQKFHYDLDVCTDEDANLADELPDLPDPNKQPVSYPKDWIVSAAFRQYCIEGLGFDDPGALKLLGLWLWGWRDKTRNLPIANNETIASLLGWESRLKGKKSVVKPALDVLARFTHVDIYKHNYQGLATCFDLPDIPFKLIDLGMEHYQPVSNPVLFGTGTRIREYIKRQHEWRLSLAASSSTNYPSDVSAGLIESLNNLPANYFRRITTTHWDKLIERACQLEPESQTDVLRALRHISFFPQPIYKRAERTSRIYSVGHSYQSLHRDLRNVVFSGCLKVDLRHSQLSIACWMYGFHELDPLLRDGTAWTHLCGESGLSKDKIKTILYSTLFMRSLEFDPYYHPALKNNRASHDDLRRFIMVKEFRALIAARENYIKNGLEDIDTDAFANPLMESDYHVKLACLSQSYELKILREAIVYVTSLKSNNICLWLHDGFFVNGNQTKFSGIGDNLTKIIDKSLNEIGIISGIESSIPMSS